MSSNVFATLHAPDMFGLVEPGIYRASSMIEAHQIEFLRALNLKSVLLLVQEPLSRPFASFIEEAGIRLKHGVHSGAVGKSKDVVLAGAATLVHTAAAAASSSWKPLSDETVKDGIEFCLDMRNHPVMVVCTSGIHETGAFVGCLRKLAGWNFNSIVVEYRAFAGSKSRYLTQQFVELFDADLITLPAARRGPAAVAAVAGGQNAWGADEQAQAQAQAQG